VRHKNNYLNYLSLDLSMDNHLYQAQKSLDVADYLLTKTLPVVGSPKMLLAILEDIHLAHDHMLRYLSDSDVSFPELFKKFMTFSRFKQYQSLILGVKKIIDEHEDASVEFERKDKFIICLDDYNLEELTVEDVKGYLFKSRELLKLVTL